MLIFIWVLIIILILVSLIGIIVPMVPDIFLLWLAFLLSYFTGAFAELSIYFWLVLIVITVLNLFSDLAGNIFLGKRFNISRAGKIGYFLGFIIGLIFLGPLGVIIGPFIIVFIITLIQKKDIKKAINSIKALLLIMVSSMFFRLFLQLIMIFWFFWSILY